MSVRGLSLWAVGYLPLICCQPSERDLISRLLSGYNTLARPVKDVATPVQVFTDYQLIFINALDERNQELHTYAWIEMRWTDEYLVWDPAEWGGLTTVMLPTNSIWVPDMVIRNSARSVRGEILDEDQKFRAVVASDGTITLWTAGNVVTSCTVDMTFFPLDDQVCHILIDSWTYYHEMVEIVNHRESMTLDYYKEGGQWKIVNTEVDVKLLKYDSQNFGMVLFKIYLRRKPLYYVYNIVLPSIILSLLVLLIFLLPADAGEKISLGITVLLSFSVFQLIIADSMPKTSDYMPLIVIYIICTMLMTGVSLLCTICVLSIHHRHPDGPVPAWLYKLVRGLAKLVCHKIKDIAPDSNKVQPFINGDHQDLVKYLPNDKNQKNGSVDMYETLQHIQADLKFLRIARQGDDLEASTKKQWVEVARVIDKVLFAFFLLVTVVCAITLFGIYPTTKPDKPVFIE